MKILIVDLEKKKISERQLEDKLAGGRLLTAQLISEFTNPQVDPLSPCNALVMAAGPLAGYRVSTGSRFSIGTKSPLTGGIKEANAGGMAGDSLSALGYRGLVFLNAFPENEPGLFVLDENGGRFAAARRYWGLNNEALAEALRADFGEDYVLIGIGRGGEQQLKAAGVAVTDANGQPFRLAARGGVGAVMGSKYLKAVLLRRGRRVPNENPTARSAVKAFNKFVATNARVEVLRDYGTASTVMPVQALGGLPTRNFGAGQFEYAENINGDRMREMILQRGGVGTPTEACMDGCVIRCSNIFPDENGELAAAPVEFETLGLCGSNIGLKTLDEIAKINRLCNDIGLDTIEVGAALGVLMEAAENGQDLPAPFIREMLPVFGDGARAAEIVQEISDGTGLGRLVGNGVVAVGKAFNVRHIPAVKNQAMSAYDPRVVKGTGVTYATTPQGADHTAGLTVFAPVDHADPALAVPLSKASQIQRAAYDALGLCVFNIGATGRNPEMIIEMVQNAYGVDLPENWLDELGRKVIRLEILFNRAAGLTKADDRIPTYFAEEPVSPTQNIWNVSQIEIDHIWDDLFSS